ncbi:MAG TPA: GtrA family protein [Geminicoccaceae bacterium]|nr:GtrA family protein [Geminicoccaceae bacterium]
MPFPPLALLAQAGRFLGAGGLATFCHWLLLVLFVQAELLHPAPASSLGYAVAVMLNYQLRRRFVFRSQAPHRHVLPRYVLVVAAGFALNGGIMALGTVLVAVPYLWVQAVATGMVAVWNFAAHRLWTFYERDVPGRIAAGSSGSSRAVARPAAARNRGAAAAVHGMRPAERARRFRPP